MSHRVDFPPVWFWNGLCCVMRFRVRRRPQIDFLMHCLSVNDNDV
jgi:hypothetical protein